MATVQAVPDTNEDLTTRIATLVDALLNEMAEMVYESFGGRRIEWTEALDCADKLIAAREWQDRADLTEWYGRRRGTEDIGVSLTIYFHRLHWNVLPPPSDPRAVTYVQQNQEGSM